MATDNEGNMSDKQDDPKGAEEEIQALDAAYAGEHSRAGQRKTRPRS